MKDLVILNRKRYKDNKLEIKEGIKVIYGEQCVLNERFDLVSLLKCELDSNEVICNYYNIHAGYCPNYLKTKLKNENNKSLESDNPNKIIKEFEKELKSQMQVYVSLYNEKECFKIIKGFGRYIFKALKIETDELWNCIITTQPFVRNDFQKILLKSIEREKLKSIINQFIQTYGVLTLLNNNEEWIDIIYTSLLVYIIMHLIKTLYEEKSIEEKTKKFRRFFKKLNALNGNTIDINEVIRTLFKNLKNAEESRLCWCKGVKVVKLKSDSKIVREIGDLIGFTINYIDNLYFENSQYYEFYQADYLVDLLEEHREYLKSKGKKEADKYTYETLDKSYTRYVLKY